MHYRLYMISTAITNIIHQNMSSFQILLGREREFTTCHTKCLILFGTRIFQMAFQNAWEGFEEEELDIELFSAEASIR